MTIRKSTEKWSIALSREQKQLAMDVRLKGGAYLISSNKSLMNSHVLT